MIRDASPRLLALVLLCCRSDTPFPRLCITPLNRRFRLLCCCAAHPCVSVDGERTALGSRQCQRTMPGPWCPHDRFAHLPTASRGPSIFHRYSLRIISLPHSESLNGCCYSRLVPAAHVALNFDGHMENFIASRFPNAPFLCIVDNDSVCARKRSFSYITWATTSRRWEHILLTQAQRRNDQIPSYSQDSFFSSRISQKSML